MVISKYRKGSVIAFMAILVVVISQSAGDLFAGHSGIDSLTRIVRSDAADSVRLQAMLELILVDHSNMDTVRIDSVIRWAERIRYLPAVSRAYNFRGAYFLEKGYNEKADFWFRKSYQRSLAGKYRVGIVKAANNLALVNIRLARFDSSEYFLKKALENFSPSMGGSMRAKIQMDLGLLYINMLQYEKALRQLLPAMIFYETVKDTVNLQAVYSNLGILYKEINRFDPAYHYFQKTISLQNRQYRSISIATSARNNIATLFQDVKKDYKGSLSWLERAKITADSIHDEPLYFTILNNLGNVYYHEGQFEKAIEAYSEVVTRGDRYISRRAQTGAYINLGSSYLELKQNRKARIILLEWAQKAASLHELNFAKIGYEGLFKIDSASGNLKAANSELRQLLWLTDSLAAIHINNKVSEMETDFRLRRQAAEMDVLAKDNALKKVTISRQKLAVGGIIFLFAVSAIFLILQIRITRRLKRLNQEILDREETIRRKNEELVGLVQTKDHLFSVISHDLKSPFNVLLGFSEMLTDPTEIRTPAEREKMIRLIHQTIRSTYELIENLLDWSRAQQGLITLSPQVVTIRESVAQVMTMLQNPSQNKSILLENTIDPVLTLYTDPKALSGTLLNLINNAIKFTPENGKIVVSALKNSDFITVTVEDNGIGIPDNLLPQIFTLNPGTRRSGTRNEPGTGLGLIICQEYVALMGGRIWVESREKEGSRFSFTVPVTQPPL